MPFTGELIGTNQISFEGAAVRYYAESLTSSTVDARRIEDSWVEIILPFSDHLKLRSDMVLPDQKTIRYGKLFEILDSLAADVAMRHAGGQSNGQDQYSVTIVTAAIDKMYIYREIDVSFDVVLRGYVGYVGSSSMEICIDILDTGGVVLGQTMFIMVARDPQSGGPVMMPKLSFDSAEDKQRYLQGELRAKLRRQKRALSLEKTPPKGSEIELIHSLYLQSRALKKQKDEALKAALSENTFPKEESRRVKVQL